MAIYRIPVEIIAPNTPSSCFNVWHARGDTPEVLWEPTTPSEGVIGALRDFYVGISNLYAANTVVRFPTLLVDPTTQTDTAIDPVDDLLVGLAGGAQRGLAATVAWKTSIRARRGMGRTFLGPLSGNVFSSAGELEPGMKAVVQGEVDALVNASSAVNGWALGVWGQEAKGVASSHVLRDFTSGSVKDKIAHLRSRRD